MNISFCKADYKDLKKLLSLCREAANAPYSTWNEDYPNEEILKQDIAAGTLYIIQMDHRDAGLIAAGENGELNCLPWDGAACRRAKSPGSGWFHKCGARALAGRCSKRP